jgi:hypothetical protein
MSFKNRTEFFVYTLLWYCSFVKNNPNKLKTYHENVAVVKKTARSINKVTFVEKI